MHIIADSDIETISHIQQRFLEGIWPYHAKYKFEFNIQIVIEYELSCICHMTLRAAVVGAKQIRTQLVAHKRGLP